MPCGPGEKAEGEDRITEYSDWKFNGRIDSGRVRCHGSGDFVRGQNRDWARVTGNNYVLQKLILYFAIPKGEVINAPEIGCCLHEYLFAPLTPTNIYLIESDTGHALFGLLDLSLGQTSIEARQSTLEDWQKEARITIQQIGWKKSTSLFERQDDWSTATFWYEATPSEPLPPFPDLASRTADIWDGE